MKSLLCIDGVPDVKNQELCLESRILHRSKYNFTTWIARSSTSDSDAYCLLCKKSFSVANGGLYQVFQHQQGTKHSAVVAASKSQPCFRIAGGSLC